MGQINELKDFTRGQLDAALMKIGQDVGMGTAEGIRAFLADEISISKPSREDDLICVDRGIAPTYPNWVKEVMHPGLETTGPEKFDVRELGRWLHEEQKGGGLIEGHKLYEYLKSNAMLESCLGLRDLEEIQKKGVKFFRQHFKGKAVFGWRSAVRDSVDNLRVPFLYWLAGEVVLDWSWLDREWFAGDSALRFAK